MFRHYTTRGLSLIFLGLAFLFSCRDNKNNNGPKPKNGDASITAISVSLGGETYNVPVPAPGGTSPLTIAKNISTARKTTAVNITKGNEGATITVKEKIFTNGDVLDFTKEVKFDVTAADRTLKTYTISITGCGSKDKPCQVSTAKQLSEIREGLENNYVLMNNITLPGANADGAAATGISDYATKGWLPIAHEATIIDGTFTGEFKGSLDGAGFIIDNFYLNRTGKYVGLFGATTGEIKNLGIKGITESPCVTASNPEGLCNIGILAGYAQGSIGNCYTSGNVLSSGSESSSVGGLVGLGWVIKINNCSASGNITVSDKYPDIGGLVGFVIGEVKNSYATGNIVGSSSSREMTAGGLAGNATNTNFENSYATGNVTASGKAYCRVGGLAGYASSDRCNCPVSPGNTRVVNCYSTGNVEGSSEHYHSAVGGLIGNSSDPVKNVYATGNVSMTDPLSKRVGVLFGRGGASSNNAFYSSEATLILNGKATTPGDSEYKTIIPKTKAGMQSDTFTGLLNGTGSVWGRDNAKNNKLPYIKGVGVGK